MELDNGSNVDTRLNARNTTQRAEPNATSGEAIFTEFYSQPLERILKPFFFASIGFSIPITQMFMGSVVWRGFLYSVLMFMSKMACGLWLVRLPSLFTNRSSTRSFWKAKSDNSSESMSKDKSDHTCKGTSQAVKLKAIPAVTSPSNQNSVEPENVERDGWQMVQDAASTDSQEGACRAESPPIQVPNPSPGRTTTVKNSNLISSNKRNNTKQQASIPATQSAANASKLDPVLNSANDKDSTNPITSPSSPAPLSLYPPLILGTAMTARGEIGFLIASLAESQGVFSSTLSSSSDGDSPPQIFLVVTWAIMLCTILGPVCVGVLVRRLKRLETGKGGKGRDVLGVWGVMNQRWRGRSEAVYDS